MNFVFRIRRAAKLLALYAVPALGVAFSAAAYPAEKQIEHLRKQVERQNRRIEMLEKRSAKSTDPASSADSGKGFELSGYGSVNYFRFDWETDPNRRNAVDVERFILELEHHFNDRWSGEVEIEFEHGGTGATLELDKFEEFGEFEQEIEQGGEVVVEELNVTYTHSKALNLRFGEMIVPIGLLNRAHEPHDYLTVQRPVAETAGFPMS